MKRLHVFLFATVGLSNLHAIEDPSLFGMMGGALGEAIRLNAARAINSGDVDPGPCAVALGFADSSGMPIGRSVSADLAPGQSSFTQFEFGAMVTRLGQRSEVRPVVTPAYPGSTAGCRFSAEVFDRFTGRTSSFARSFFEDPNLQPTPAGDFAPIGVALGQVLRLNLVAVDPGPCRALMSFASSNGTAVGPSFTANLMPGQATLLDLPMSTVPLAFGQRIEIVPVVRTDPTASSCIASAEVWDVFTGRTAAYEGPVHDRQLSPMQ
jgi:hypothetical protein